MEGGFKHTASGRRDVEGEQKKTSAMLSSLRRIVREEIAKDRFYNLDRKKLGDILKKHPQMFFGITQPENLVDRLATNMKDLRQKLGLPESINRGF